MFLRNTTIRTKIVVGILIASALSLTVATFLSVRNAQESLTKARFAALESIADLKKDKVEMFFQQLESDMKVIQDYYNIKKNFPIIARFKDNTRHPQYITAKRMLDGQLQAWLGVRDEIFDLHLMDREKESIYNIRMISNHAQVSIEDMAFEQGQRGMYFTDVFRTTHMPSGYGMLLITLARGLEGQPTGAIVLEIDMGPLYRFIQDRTGLGETGETILGRNEGDHALFLTPLRHDRQGAPQRKVSYLNQKEAQPMVEATQGIAGAGSTFDYRPEPVIAVWRPLTLPNAHLQWGLVTKMDTAEAFAPIRRLQTRMLLASLIIFLIVLPFAFFFGTSITQPIWEAQEAAKAVAAGNLGVTLRIHGRDEISALAASFNTMTEHLSKTQQQLQVAKERAEEEAQSARKFQRAVVSSTDAIAMTDHTGKIIYVNPAWERLTGYSFREVQEKTPRLLESEHMPPKLYEEMWRTIVRGDTFHTEEMVYQRKNGSTFAVELDIYPISEDGDIQFYVYLQRDITRRKRAEAAKSEFVSLASHQLRTPLTAIRWSLKRFWKESKMLGRKERHLLEEAQKASVRMADIIAAMLSISRIEAGRVHLERKDVPLCALLSEVIQHCRECHKDKKLKVTLECPTDFSLHTDRALLTDILGNLLTNAFKYTPKSGRITVRAQREQDHCLIEVQDTGCGIPAHQQDKVFSKFFRGDNVIDEHPDGTGLGLHLVHSLSELLGGTVSFVSQEGRGTTFSLLLPLSAPTTSDPSSSQRSTGA